MYAYSDIRARAAPGGLEPTAVAYTQQSTLQAAGTPLL